MALESLHSTKPNHPNQCTTHSHHYYSQAYALLSRDLGDIEGARRLFGLGARADKAHLAVYQARVPKFHTPKSKISTTLFRLRFSQRET